MPFLKKSTYYVGPVTDHFDGIRFYNPWNPRKHSWLGFIRWRMYYKSKPWPKHVENVFFDQPPAHVKGSKLRVCFIGHATVLIQTQGLNILTDPIWTDWATPVKIKKIKRVCDPGLSFENLPKIDLILVSHNHYDHLNQETIERLWERDKPLILSPLGNDTIIKQKNPSIQVTTLDWEQSYKINDKVTIHLQPSQHWSARGLWDKNKALWGAFTMETPGGNIYFAGDTGYGHGEVFYHVKEKFGKFRLAILPIGAYEPRWFMKYAHMNPEDAVTAYRDLGKPYTMGIHFGTFRFSDEGYKDPIKDLETSKRNHKISDEKFRTLNVGESWDVPESG